MNKTWKSLSNLWRRFGRDRAGNMAILFAFMALPLTLLMGLGIDYYRGLSTQARLNQASDAAALAAVNTAVNYVKTNPLQLSGDALTSAAASAGQTQGASAFTANMGIVADEVQSTVTPIITVSPSTSLSNGQTVNAFSATVTYSTTISAAFGPLMGIHNYPVDGKSASTAIYPLYLDMHIVIDNSESMGIGASASDQDAMTAAIGCTVACHYPWGSYPDGTWVTVRQMNPAPQLRIDVVRSAVVAELQKIKNVTFAGQIRVALYTFSTRLTQIYALSENIQGAIDAVSTIDIATDNDDGGTYATYALQSMASTLRNLPTPGDGTSSTKRQGYVLFFTDGIQDSSSKYQPSGADRDETYGCNTNAYPNFYAYGPTWCEYGVSEGFDPAHCQDIRDLNYNMLTLDFEYIVTQAAYNSDGRYQQIQNVLKPQIATNMLSCAGVAHTNGGYQPYATTASTPAEFMAALDKLVNTVLANVRLTQ